MTFLSFPSKIVDFNTNRFARQLLRYEEVLTGFTKKGSVIDPIVSSVHYCIAEQLLW